MYKQTNCGNYNYASKKTKINKKNTPRQAKVVKKKLYKS